MVYAGLVLFALVCAAQAIRMKKLLTSVMWLVGLSAAIAVIFYMLGATRIAVIELSVGAGLITVLLVFAISVVGDDIPDTRPIIPLPLAWILVGASTILLGLSFFPAISAADALTDTTFASVFWEDRSLDVILQVFLLFAGVIGVLGLLSSKQGTGYREGEE